MSKLGRTLLSVNLFTFPAQNSEIEEYSILVLILFLLVIFFLLPK